MTTLVRKLTIAKNLYQKYGKNYFSMPYAALGAIGSILLGAKNKIGSGATTKEMSAVINLTKNKPIDNYEKPLLKESPPSNFNDFLEFIRRYQ